MFDTGHDSTQPKIQFVIPQRGRKTRRLFLSLEQLNNEYRDWMKPHPNSTPKFVPGENDEFLERIKEKYPITTTLKPGEFPKID